MAMGEPRWPEKTRKEEIQMLIPGGLTRAELHEERQRVWKELGLARMEREGRSVLVGRRRIKAWRMRGTPEYDEHARLVAMMAEVFSR